ncbi:unnamed protein product [Lasius platythorax]|uniref:Uncharacterized protein n=1 Tax=Lasius platythorax TaxID=488582 RepID=A0AAV2N6J5_9HYME
MNPHNAIPDVFLGRRRKGFLPTSPFFTIHLITWAIIRRELRISAITGKIDHREDIFGERHPLREGGGRRKRAKPAVSSCKVSEEDNGHTLPAFPSGFSVIPAAVRYCS